MITIVTTVFSIKANCSRRQKRRRSQKDVQKQNNIKKDILKKVQSTLNRQFALINTSVNDPRTLLRAKEVWPGWSARHHQGCKLSAALLSGVWSVMTVATTQVFSSTLYVFPTTQNVQVLLLELFPSFKNWRVRDTRAFWASNVSIRWNTALLVIRKYNISRLFSNTILNNSVLWEERWTFNIFTVWLVSTAVCSSIHHIVFWTVFEIIEKIHIAWRSSDTQQLSPVFPAFRKLNWQLESCLAGTDAYCSLPLKEFPSGPTEFGLIYFKWESWRKRSHRSRNYFAGPHQSRAP